jgi:hypothetical protein
MTAAEFKLANKQPAARHSNSHVGAGLGTNRSKGESAHWQRGEGTAPAAVLKKPFNIVLIQDLFILVMMSCRPDRCRPTDTRSENNLPLEVTRFETCRLYCATQNLGILLHGQVS